MGRSGDEMGDGERHEARVHEMRTLKLVSAEWIRTLPGDLLEPHPLVRELRRILEAKAVALADKEREIARLHVALAFGLKELPRESRRMDRPPAD